MSRLLLGLCLIFWNAGQCQLSGTVQVPGTYTSLAAVITALNQQGVSGPLVVKVNSGYTETVASGGLSLIATGTASAPIVFEKSGGGPKPRLYAGSGGNGTPGSANQDGIWKLIGCDYITIDGFELIDTNSTYPATMEFGFGFFKNNGLDGCQHNTIKNCRVQLSNLNNASGAGSGGDGSRALNVINALATAQTSSVTVYAPSGSNSFNRFYSNQFLNCNTGIYLVGYPDSFPFSLADTGNEIGGNSSQTGNQIVNFGGGFSGNPAYAIRTVSQYNSNIAFNEIISNTGTITNHTTTLKGISVGSANGANVSVHQNTITLHGGGLSSVLTAIENAAGASGTGNAVRITNNRIVGCTYSTAVSAPFYGIHTTSSATTLHIDSNYFYNNSTASVLGNSYLIYNNGPATAISMRHNVLAFSWNAANSSSGNLFAIYNNAASPTATLSIQNNRFLKFESPQAIASGTWYFIYNTADCVGLFIEGNRWKDLYLNHSGNQFFMYNSSSTQSVLSVCNNSLTGLKRTAPAAHTYGYYAAANSAGTATQTFSNNLISGINAPLAGAGNFYGIFNAEGNLSPYPQKIIAANTIENISINATGNCYGIYCSGAGDANTGGGSSVQRNTIRNIRFENTMHGIYVTGAGSSLFPLSIYANTVMALTAGGNNAAVYGAYLANATAGIKFYRNRVSDLSSSGAFGIVHGIYGTNTNTTSMENNLVANLNASSSVGSNRVNGIFLNAGSYYELSHNTVLLQASSTGTAFGTNALYASSTVSLMLRNNILVNRSQPSGNGIVAAYRRSTSSLSNFLTGSDHNLFYAGTPSASTVIFYNGSTAYQTLSAYQSTMLTRDQASITQDPQWMSVMALSSYFLHIATAFPTALESGAVPIGTISEDCDEQPRQGSLGYVGTGSSPDIGADEFELNTQACTGAVPPVLTSTSAWVCATQSPTLSASNVNVGSGYLYQWKLAQQSGGPYTSIASSTAATALEHVATGLPVGTHYFVVEVACITTSQSALSQELVIQVHAPPTLSLASNTLLVCKGSALVLNATASGTTDWIWEGPNAYMSTLQTPTLENCYTAAAGVYSVKAMSAYCSSSTKTLAVSVSELTLAISASSSVVCTGASTTLHCVSSGITHTWSTGALTATISVSPTQSTIYSVSATNSLGCVAMHTLGVNVIQPTLQATGALVCQTPALVTLSVSAFNPSVVHWFSTSTSTQSIASGNTFSLSVNTATTLFVQASDQSSGCQSMKAPVTVSVSSFPTLTLSASPATVCPGKPTVLGVSGASSYTWHQLGTGASKTVSPLAQSVYSVSASNGGSCITQGTIVIYTYSLPLVTVFPTSVSACPSQPSIFSAAGAQSYTWSTGVIAPTATLFAPLSDTYTVYGSISNGCVSTATLAIITRSLPVVVIETPRDTICSGETVVLNAVGAVSYTWLPGGNMNNAVQVDPKVSSVYNAIGLGVNGCTNVAIASIHVEECLSTTELNRKASFHTFPNPLSDQLYISCTEGDVQDLQLELLDALGHLVKIQVERGTGATRMVNLRHTPSGCYVLIIKSSGVLVDRRVLIKQPSQ